MKVTLLSFVSYMYNDKNHILCTYPIYNSYLYIYIYWVWTPLFTKWIQTFSIYSDCVTSYFINKLFHYKYLYAKLKFQCNVEENVMFVTFGFLSVDFIEQKKIMTSIFPLWCQKNISCDKGGFCLERLILKWFT